MTVAARLAATAWHDVLDVEPGVLGALDRFVAAERAAGEVCPPASDVVRAFELVAPADVRAVILGQDPYPTPGHAHGLAFSYRGTGPRPRSLVNVFRELENDLGVSVPPDAGDLTPWALQGVLLLNVVLTVRAGEPGSHRGRGWEQVTQAALRALVRRGEPVVFMLWGGEARKRARLVHRPHHVLEAGHPSPLSVRHFAGCRHFSKANALLGERAVDWGLDPLARARRYPPERARRDSR